MQSFYLSSKISISQTGPSRQSPESCISLLSNSLIWFPPRPKWPCVAPCGRGGGGISQTPTPGRATLQHYSTVQDDSTGHQWHDQQRRGHHDCDGRVPDQDELPPRPDGRHLHPPVSSADRLCDNVSIIMTQRGQVMHHPLSLFRLVYIYVQRRNPRIHSHHKCCHHQSRAPELFINNAVSSHQYLTRTHHPKQIWTVESHDPIYEDITEVKKKIERGTNITKETTKAVKSQGSLKSSPSVSSNVQYGVITAKEVAKFVPCTDVNIRRWWMWFMWLISPWLSSPTSSPHDCQSRVN